MWGEIQRINSSPKVLRGREWGVVLRSDLCPTHCLPVLMEGPRARFLLAC